MGGAGTGAATPGGTDGTSLEIGLPAHEARRVWPLSPQEWNP